MSFLATACAVTIVTSSICYAEPVIIKSSPSAKEAQWIKYPGQKNTILQLTTLGMQVAAEGEGLIRIWHTRSGTVHVAATCTPTKGPSSYVNMFPQLWEGDSDVIPPLTCLPGEGISVRMPSPNNPNPDAYVYHGELTRISVNQAPQSSQVEDLPPQQPVVVVDHRNVTDGLPIPPRSSTVIVGGLVNDGSL